jgi:hypothetical protein
LRPRHRRHPHQRLLPHQRRQMIRPLMMLTMIRSGGGSSGFKSAEGTARMRDGTNSRLFIDRSSCRQEEQLQTGAAAVIHELERNISCRWE